MSNESDNFKIDGMNEIVQALNDLPAHLSQKILDNYLKSTAKKYIINSMKTELPYSVKTKIGIKVSKDKLQYLAVVAGPTSDSFILRFLDKGTKLRRYKGASRGLIVGKFRIPGIVSSQIQPIIDNAQKDIGQSVENFMNKNKKTK